MKSILNFEDGDYEPETAGSVSARNLRKTNSGQSGKQENIMDTHYSHAHRPARRVLGRLILIAAITFTALIPAAGFGENPADEMFKPDSDTNALAGVVARREGDTNVLTRHATGPAVTYGSDPQGDSWQAMQHSIGQFAHLEFVLRLFLSFSLAVACAWLVAWHPRRSSRLDSLSDLEERKTLIVLGMVGAVVAELSGSNQTLAFVIFGIGALLRFRTVMDNPKLTGKAITVVVIGLACGMGSWTMAVFVTAFSWVLIYWLDSHIACRVRIRVAEEVDAKLVFGSVQALFVARRCRLQSSAVYKRKRQLEFLLHIPADLDLKQLELDLRAKLPKPDEARIQIDVV
jgi:hypothetical protein